MGDKAERALKLRGITVQSLVNPRKTGILTKRGGRKANWRKRFIVLHEGKLYYFKNQKAKQPKGSVDLEPTSTCGETAVKKKCAFQISTTKRVFFLFANDDADKRSWMEAINQAIADLKPEGAGGDDNVDDTPEKKPEEEKKPDDDDNKKDDSDDEPNNEIKDPTPKPKVEVKPESDKPRDRLTRAKEVIPFLRKQDSKVVEFWQIWSESFPPAEGLTSGTTIEFEVSTSLSMEKLKWRTCGPQNMFIQRMVDFFFDVGASESEIDRLNNIGALIEPSKIGSWIEMSDKQGMDGGWYFPVDMPVEKAIQAADAGEAVDKVKEWIQKHKVDTCYSVGRDMGAMPPRQTSMKLNLPGL
eukprot:TRINITY_DN461_c0_g1_i1.p1 TRINITY_DN461_c0_g1~~TRINITY_DN461_c0_g1_i1.p1  ORF type:complete len:356 (+),score=80.01 TRINITY_DN461_c0_g1_i1:596-1663(+)